MQGPTNRPRHIPELGIVPQGMNSDLRGNACLRYRPFQCSLQPFRKKTMSTDNVAMWIAERESQSPQAIGSGDPRLLALSPQLKKIYCAVIDSGLRLPTLELTAAYA